MPAWFRQMFITSANIHAAVTLCFFRAICSSQQSKELFIYYSQSQHRSKKFHWWFCPRFFLARCIVGWGTVLPSGYTQDIAKPGIFDISLPPLKIYPRIYTFLTFLTTKFQKIGKNRKNLIPDNCSLFVRLPFPETGQSRLCRETQLL